MPLLKLVEPVGNKEEKMVNSEIGSALGFSVHEFDDMKTQEVIKFRRSIFQFVSEIFQVQWSLESHAAFQTNVIKVIHIGYSTVLCTHHYFYFYWALLCAHFDSWRHRRTPLWRTCIFPGEQLCNGSLERRTLNCAVDFFDFLTFLTSSFWSVSKVSKVSK